MVISISPNVFLTPHYRQSEFADNLKVEIFVGTDWHSWPPLTWLKFYLIKPKQSPASCHAKPVPSGAASLAINKAEKEGETLGQFRICQMSQISLKISSHRIFHFVTGKVIRFKFSLKRIFTIMKYKTLTISHFTGNMFPDPFLFRFSSQYSSERRKRSVYV